MSLTGPVFAICGVRIGIAGLAASCRTELEAAWSEFASHDPADRWLMIEDPDGTGPLLSELPAWEARAEGLCLWGTGYQARLGEGGRLVSVAGRGDLEAISGVLKRVVAHALWERQGLLLHGAGLAAQRACLFVGESGAGKSTLAGLGVRGGLRLLSDELVAVIPSEDGWRVEGSPWNVGKPGRFPLGLIGRLAHGASARLQSGPISELMPLLLSNVVHPDAEPATRGELFRALSLLLTDVPSQTLTFAIDLGVVDVLRDALSEARK